jgi:hypothetical protein
MIDHDKVYAYFERYHGPVQTSTNGWYSCKCPKCGKDKFAVNFTYLVGKCWKGCYDRPTFLVDVIRMFHGLNYFETRELIDSMTPGLLRVPQSVNKVSRNATIKLPTGYHPILDGTGTLGVRARAYLKKRGFDLNYMDRIGVGYCNEEDEDKTMDYFGYIIIPFKKHGILSYYIGRDFLDRGDLYRYKNPAKEKCGVGKMEVFFNEEALYMQSKVYQTEGWACASTIGPQGISIQGSTPSIIQRNIIIKSDIKELIIVPDAGYYMKGLEAARDMMRYKKVKVLDLNCVIHLEIGKDVNEIGKEMMLSIEADTPWLTTSLLYKELKNA